MQTTYAMQRIIKRMRNSSEAMLRAVIRSIVSEEIDSSSLATLNEMLKFSAATTRSPDEKMGYGMSAISTEFKIDEQTYKIWIQMVGPTTAKFADISFERIKYDESSPYGKGTTETTGESFRQVAKIISTVYNWSAAWLANNKSKVRAFSVAGDASESSRTMLYKRLSEKVAGALGMSVKEVSASDAGGTGRIVYIVYDPAYNEKYPKYREALNKVLMQYFKTSV